MTHFTNNELIELLKLTTKTKENLIKSGTVGCYSCTSIYKYKEIDVFVNYGKTALCPYCGVDAVIPLAKFTPDQQGIILNELNRKFFHGEPDNFVISL